jgi:hypothetical protein
VDRYQGDEKLKEVPRDEKWNTEAGDEQPTEWQGEHNPNMDPFSPENVGVVQAITLLRIYDVLLAGFMQKYPVAGKRLMEKHAKGGFMAPPPAFNPEEVEQYGDPDGATDGSD